MNKFNQMYRSLALSKEKNKNKISISSCEKYDFIRNRADSQNKLKEEIFQKEEENNKLIEEKTEKENEIKKWK